MGCTTSKQARQDLRRTSSLLPPGLGRPDTASSSADEQMKKTANDHHAKPPRAPPQSRTCATTPTPHETETETETETINAWELMEGLEDVTPIRPSLHCRSRSSSGSFVSDFDPEIISTFRRALAELSPRHPFFLCSPARQKSPDLTGIVRARIKLFQERIDSRRRRQAGDYRGPPGGEGKVVLYSTTLRGIRQTFEDCCAVRTMLEGCYGLRVDERDVSMHAGFKDELTQLLGPAGCRRLPLVFANGCCLGGAEEVKEMHQAGQLGRAVEDCQMAAVAATCEGCGDVRFVPCGRCSGSCKVFVEDQGEECCRRGRGGFRQCPDCNENGTVRCPVC